ncbi:hypothetical protein EB118_17585 [bacterium]|nr:hypothetical protein [bacterium]NDG31871.1 hypothetical protein [bacterium]
MDKVVKDGYVAVVLSAEYGIGWYKGDSRVLFDPEIVYMVLEGRLGEELHAYCKRMCYDVYIPVSRFNKGVNQFLDIHWIKEGTDFYVNSYDGLEKIKIGIEWIRA